MKKGETMGPLANAILNARLDRVNSPSTISRFADHLSKPPVAAARPHHR
jgi:hypothetical protein